MDGDRFDRFARALAARRSRRHLVVRVAVGLAAALHGPTHPEAAAAKARPPRPRGQRSPQPLLATTRCQSGRLPCGDGCCRAGQVCVDGHGCAPADAVPCDAGYCPAAWECRDGRCLAPCPGRLRACDDRCVDTGSDPHNCGDCRFECASTGAICDGGACTCPRHQLDCGGTCTDLTTVDNCGQCDRQCFADQVCTNGDCAWRCPHGTEGCDRFQQCVPRGTCCAEQHELCAPHIGFGCCDAALACSEAFGICCNELGGACTATGNCCPGFACDAGRGVCCVPSPAAGAITPAPCGQDADCCDPAVGCRDGRCCNAGGASCTGDGQCCSGCCNDGTCASSAGGSCDDDGQCCAGATCSGQGVCQPACDPGTLPCGGGCVDPTDPNNCGGCGTVCGACEACDGEACRPCDALGFLCCDDTCVSRDVFNCTGCGERCPPLANCLDGACVCLDDRTLCGRSCIDTSSDPGNCGGCDNSCFGGDCVDGTCVG